jgi:hypothetical protein
MFMVSKEAAAAIRAIFNQEGEMSAAIELRRRFPGISDNAKARECVRIIAGWEPLPGQGGGVGEPGTATVNRAVACQITRLRPRRARKPGSSTP